jgi:hypothetical protein
VLAGFASGSALAAFCGREACGLAVATFLLSAGFVSTVERVLPPDGAVCPGFAVVAVGSDLACGGCAADLPSTPPPEVGAAEAPTSAAAVAIAADARSERKTGSRYNA